MTFSKRIAHAISLFKEQGGILRTTQAIRLGIHPEIIYQMKSEGIIRRLTRGIYRLSNLPPFKEPLLVTAALALPKGVICLTTALRFHGLTTELSNQVDVAYRRGAKRPVLGFPPIRLFYFSEKVFDFDVERREIEGVSMRIYSPEKTLADCFKHRKRIGLDIAIQALKTYWNEKRGDVDRLVKSARICRVEKTIKPYLESIIHG